jgi:hypothetical protein
MHPVIQVSFLRFMSCTPRSSFNSLQTSDESVFCVLYAMFFFPCPTNLRQLGLARTVYTHRIWPYNWWIPCQKNVYAPYIYIYMVLANPTDDACNAVPPALFFLFAPCAVFLALLEIRQQSLPLHHTPPSFMISHKNLHVMPNFRCPRCAAWADHVSRAFCLYDFKHALPCRAKFQMPLRFPKTRWESMHFAFVTSNTLFLAVPNPKCLLDYPRRDGRAEQEDCEPIPARTAEV